MLRSDMTKAIDNVTSALAESRAAEFLENALRRPDRDNISELFELALKTFQVYAARAAAFGPLEDQLINMLGLHPLSLAGFWMEATTGRFMRYSPEIVADVIRAESRLTTLRKWLTPEEQADRKDSRPEDRLVPLQILVVEENGQLSRPARLVSVLQGVTDLYEVHASLQDVSSESLLIAACDTGSDFAFDFLGLAKVVESVKETLLSLWDRVVFFRERKLSVQIDLIAQALPVLDEIAEMEKRQAIEREMAAILRQKVMTGATQLVEAGAIVSGQAGRPVRDIRALAAPEQKLLAAPEEISGKSQKGDNRPRVKRLSKKTQ